MPGNFYIYKKCDKMPKRKCTCGGNPQIVIQETSCYFLVRCEKCHESTYMCMSMDEAIQDWENGVCTGPFDMIEDDLQKNICDVKFLYFTKEDFCKTSPYSCVCEQLALYTLQKLVLLENDYENIAFSCITATPYTFEYEINLSDQMFKLDCVDYSEDGLLKSLRYKCGDLSLSIVAVKDTIRVIMSNHDFPGSDVTPDVREISVT